MSGRGPVLPHQQLVGRAVIWRRADGRSCESRVTWRRTDDLQPSALSLTHLAHFRFGSWLSHCHGSEFEVERSSADRFLLLRVSGCLFDQVFNATAVPQITTPLV